MDINERTAARLGEDKILWLTTVSGEGRPQSSPVWFLWDGADQLLVYSLDDTARLDNITANPMVAANLNSNATGGDIVTMEGTARIDRDFPAATEVDPYLAKYRELLDSYGWTPDHFAAEYPVPVLITIDRVRAAS